MFYFGTEGGIKVCPANTDVRNVRGERERETESPNKNKDSVIDIADPFVLVITHNDTISTTRGVSPWHAR